MGAYPFITHSVSRVWITGGGCVVCRDLRNYTSEITRRRGGGEGGEFTVGVEVHMHWSAMIFSSLNSNTHIHADVLTILKVFENRKKACNQIPKMNLRSKLRNI